jgi:hypothetical protein
MNNASLELGGTNWAEKDGNILGYSVGDTSGKYSPQEFTFARGSNLSATRIDRAGLIVKGRENQILHSNGFSNSVYFKTFSSVTSGQSGYDSSNDAWLYQSTGGGASYFYQSQTITQIKTRSIYAKAGTQSTITFLWDSFNNNEFATFDLSSGTFTNAGCLASMESVGGGWYRCSTTITDASNGYAFLISLSNETGVALQSGSNIYIQDAQQEAGLAASPYIETTTTTAQAGVLENTPRLNYTTGVANPYLLLEPSRTNLFSQSEYIESLFIISGGSFTANYGASPEGYNNSVRVQATSLTTSHFYYAINLTAGTQYAISCYYKGTSGEKANLRAISTSGGASANNLITFNGSWQRETILFTAGTAANYVYVYDARAGNSTATDFEVFGFQVEAGSYPTSYIPTYSVSATRAQDVCNKLDASDLIGTEFTLFFDGYQSIESQYSRYIVLKGTGGTYVNFISIETNPNNQVAVNVNTGSSVFIATTQRTSGERLKMALRCKDNDFAFYINGVLIKSQTSGSVPVTSDLYLGYYTDYAENYNVINQTQIYKEALTDAELATLTTI